MKSEKVQRDSNIELLRIVLMFMIIVHHLVTRGLKLRELGSGTYTPMSSTTFQILLNSFIIVAVNTYVFISGYFEIKFKIKVLISFLIQCLFYSILLYLIFVWLGLNVWSIKGFAMTFYFLYKGWWFVPVYLTLYALSPMLNKGLAGMNQKQLICMIIVLLILAHIKFVMGNFISDRGFGIYNFIFIYAVAHYCRNYVKKVDYAWLWYTCCSLLIFAMAYGLYLFGKPKITWAVYNYNNPVMILSAVFLFYTFKNISIRSGLINSIAGLVFGTYLFHEQRDVCLYLRDHVMVYVQDTVHNDIALFASIFLLAVLVFIAGISIEKIRQYICDPVLNYLYSIKWVQRVSDLN
ncbi:Surface polysaccharide O-acyltransferase, integral membrane enzyme [Chitinophaga sp. CF118]|uniref:acyltransferase family protein n=1 Tax=Chitinophaga sp. CF118 TaxID=1884367 RepID=UPI0008EE3740|nr:acyltransferase family protein [Chitinophaga sp. CF118]SFE02610.1 Surface polysaccharide O-acyltransferase, integral membrane enzyme [Chitinophaga sp. CF118]